MERAVVLVVEDELPVQRMLEIILVSGGFEVRIAGTFAEALDIMETNRIDAMTLDVQLPDPEGLHRNGLVLLSYLRAIPKYAALPVLILTGALSFVEADSAARHGAYVLYKPQPFAAILERLNMMLPNRERVVPNTSASVC